MPFALAARAHARQCAVFVNGHGANVVVVAHAHHHDVGVARSLCGAICRGAAELSDPARGLFDRSVVYR